MSEFTPKYTEQEVEAENFIRAFLQEHGFDLKVRANMQRLFLYGIYNGLVVAKKMIDLGGYSGINTVINIFKVHFSARERNLKEFADKEVQ